MYVNWTKLTALAVLHVLAIASIPYMWHYGVSLPEAGFHITAYLLGGFGITVLYHRVWTHNAAKLARPLEYFLAVCSTFVFQNCAREWVSHHIKHHNHTDHDADPYNIQRGFWWAHFEWIIFAPMPPVELPARLATNPVIAWQAKYYWLISAVMNGVLPVAIGAAAGAPWWGGLLLSALRLSLMSHVVFSVNSICHWWGTRPFTREVSARDVWWFPFALGEQYHNYHHAFPRDYRHGVRAYDFDPTKWVILLLSRLGLARDLFYMPDRRIQAAMEETAAQESADALALGDKDATLAENA
jgi:stearoyl-CoA desaturase (delta-9 desaturase)